MQRELLGRETRVFRRIGPAALPEATLDGEASREEVEDEIIAKYFPLITDKSKLVIIWLGTTMSVRLRGSEANPVVIQTKEFHPRVC